MENVPDNETLPDLPGAAGVIFRKCSISADMRLAIYNWLVSCLVDGSLPRGTVAEASRIFSVSRHAVYNVWERGMLQEVNCFEDRRAGNSRPRKYCAAELTARLKEVPHPKRSTIRDSALAVGIPPVALKTTIKSTVSSVRVRVY
jgi:hypothetical protein